MYKWLQKVQHMKWNNGPNWPCRLVRPIIPFPLLNLLQPLGNAKCNYYFPQRSAYPVITVDIFIFQPAYLHILALAVLVRTPVESLQPLPQLGHEVDPHHVLLPTLQSPVELGHVKLPVGVVNVLQDIEFSTAVLLDHSHGVVVEGLGCYSVV